MDKRNPDRPLSVRVRMAIGDALDPLLEEEDCVDATFAAMAATVDGRTVADLLDSIEALEAVAEAAGVVAAGWSPGISPRRDALLAAISTLRGILDGEQDEAPDVDDEREWNDWEPNDASHR